MKTRFTIGGIYSVVDKSGYGVVKILAIDDEAVHIRVYKNKFSARPSWQDISNLTMGTIHDKDGFGMGHLPMSHGAFERWQPEFVAKADVSANELEGYNIYKEYGGSPWA